MENEQQEDEDLVDLFLSKDDRFSEDSDDESRRWKPFRIPKLKNRSQSSGSKLVVGLTPPEDKVLQPVPGRVEKLFCTQARNSRGTASLQPGRHQRDDGESGRGSEPSDCAPQIMAPAAEQPIARTTQTPSPDYQLWSDAPEMASTSPGDSEAAWFSEEPEEESMDFDLSPQCSEADGASSPMSHVRYPSTYVVVDTNILIDHLPRLEQLLSEAKGILYLPRAVIAELDKLSKSGKSELQFKARRGNDFVMKHLKQKSAGLRGQMGQEEMEAETFPVTDADDRIVQAGMQLMSRGLSVLLLTKDKNLSSRAMIHGLQCISISELDRLDKVATCLQQSPPKECNAPVEMPESRPVGDNRQPHQTDIFNLEDDQLQDILFRCLSQWVEKEMRAVYHDDWMQIVVVKPPWQLKDVLRCIQKHWVAVFSHVPGMNSYAKLNFDTIQNKMKTSPADWWNESSFKDRSELVEAAEFILQRLPSFSLAQATLKQIQTFKKLLLPEALFNDILDLLTALVHHFCYILGVSLASLKLSLPPPCQCVVEVRSSQAAPQHAFFYTDFFSDVLQKMMVLKEQLSQLLAPDCPDATLEAAFHNVFSFVQECRGSRHRPLDLVWTWPADRVSVKRELVEGPVFRLFLGVGRKLMLKKADHFVHVQRVLNGLLWKAREQEMQMDCERGEDGWTT